MECAATFGNYMVTKRKALSSVRSRPKTAASSPSSKLFKHDAKEALVSIICNYTGGYHRTLLNGYRHSLPPPTMKNGLNGLTRGGNGIAIAHKDSLLNYMKKHGKVKQEPASPAKKVKKRVSFGPDTVKIFSEMDYFTGEKAMLQEIARGQRIRDIKKSLRNNQKKEDKAPIVNGRRSSFCRARTQIKKQLPVKCKRSLTKAASLHSPDHVVRTSSVVEKREDNKTTIEDDKKSSDKDYSTKQCSILKDNKDDIKDTVRGKEVKNTNISEAGNGDGKDSSKKNMLVTSRKDSPYVILQKFNAEDSGKAVEETTAISAKIGNSSVKNVLKVQKLYIGRPKGTTGRVSTVPRELRRLWIDFRKVPESNKRKDTSDDCARSCTNGSDKPLRDSAQHGDCSQQELDSNPDNSCTEPRKGSGSSSEIKRGPGRPYKRLFFAQKKLCTSLNTSSSESLKSESEEYPNKPTTEIKKCNSLKTDFGECLNMPCKDPKDVTLTVEKKKLQISLSKSRNRESERLTDVTQFELRSSVRKLRPKPPHLDRKVCQRPLKLCKSTPVKRINLATSKHSQEKAESTSKSSKRQEAKHTGSSRRTTKVSNSCGNPSQGVALKRKASKTSKLCTKAKKAKYREDLKEEEKVVTKEKNIVKKAEQVTTKEEKAAKKEEKVATKEKKAAEKEEKAAEKEEKAAEKEEKVVTKEKNIVKKVEQVTTKKEKAAKKEEKVATKEKKAADKEEKAAEKEEKAAEKEEKVVTKEKNIVKKVEQVTTKKEKAAKKEEKVATKEKKAADKEEKAAEKEEKAAEKEEKVVTKEDKVATKEEKVTTKEEKVATKEEKVTTKEEKVATKEKKDAKMAEKAAKMAEKAAKMAEKVATKEKKAATKEKTVVKEKKVATVEKKVATNDEKVLNEEKRVAKNEEKRVAKNEKKVVKKEKKVAKKTDSKPNDAKKANMYVKKPSKKSLIEVKKCVKKTTKKSPSEVKKCVKIPTKKSPIEVKKCDKKPTKKSPSEVKKCVKIPTKKSPIEIKKCDKKPTKKSPSEVKKCVKIPTKKSPIEVKKCDKKPTKKSPSEVKKCVKKLTKKSAKEVKKCVKEPAKKSPNVIKKCVKKPAKKSPKVIKKCVKKPTKKSPKVIKKCVKNPTKKIPKEVKKSQISVHRDKVKVERILKSYVLAYKQGKKNLLYKLLKNGIHVKDKKLLKNGLLLKDCKWLENGLLNNKKLPKK